MVILLALACSGGGGGGGGGGGVQEVCYDLDDDPPSCCNPDDRSTFESDGARSVDCIWYCGKYDGKKRYVDLSFWDWGDGEGWVLESEYVSSCI